LYSAVVLKRIVHCTVIKFMSGILSQPVSYDRHSLQQSLSKLPYCSIYYLLLCAIVYLRHLLRTV